MASFIHPKFWLIIKKNILTEETIEQYQSLLYDKIYILYNQWKKDYTIGKITLLGHTNIEEWIQKIYEIKPDDITLIPFFFWDLLAKHGIDIYNHEFNTNVEYSCFKDKNIINKTIQTACKKHFLFYTFKQLQQATYGDITEKWFKKFMIKPQSWSSSLLTFLVENQEEFTNVKKKILPKFDYVIEEYFDGELNSVDFYHDGKNIYILAYIKEYALKDFFDAQKLSEDFLHTYRKDLKLFNFFIPVRYNESLTNITPEELDFLSKIRNILTQLTYRWLIHLEYKFDTSTHTIGFVERWARLWFKRNAFIENAYTTTTKVLDIPYLVHSATLEKFHNISPWMYMLNEMDTHTSILWMRTTFYKKTKKNITTIAAFKEQLSSYLRDYFYKTYMVKITDIQYIIKYEEWNIFYPFYQSNTTRLDYLLFFSDKDFVTIKKNIGKITEHLIFNDFMLP